MAKSKARDAGKPYRLYLVDTSEAALDALLPFLDKQVRKLAEKDISELRTLYADRTDLVENGEIISAHLDVLKGLLRPGTDLAPVGQAFLVFEAIVEDRGVKAKVYLKLAESCSPGTFFLTNTSSIPISAIEKEAGLTGRVLGYHFYNPPAVQKLVEVIASSATLPELKQLGAELGAALRKKLVPSRDIAGFIGNGHFMRDGLHGMAEAEKLAGEHGWPAASYALNRVSQEFLVRPMGIFQLIDYVGIDVFDLILQVMHPHHPQDGLQSAIVTRFLSQGVKGGQRGDGSQKDGFFTYPKGRPEQVWNPEKKAYEAIEGAPWKAAIDAYLGPLPQGHKPWKALLSDPGKEAFLAGYFGTLAKQETPGAQLARAYLRRSREIGAGLVKTGVAESAREVNDVLTNGFFHLYGPLNEYCQ